MTQHRLGWEAIWAARELDPIARAHAGPPEADVVRFAERLQAEGRRRVLDLGCGIGRHLLFLAGEGFDAWGVDVSPTAIATSARALRDAGLRATLVQADMARLPLAAAFDAAVAWNVIYHGTLNTIVDTVAGVARALRQGGLFLVTFNSTENDAALRARAALATGAARELEPNTYVMLGDPGDKGLAHHYTTEREIRRRLLPGFRVLDLEHRRISSLRGGRPHRTARFVVLAEKT